MPITTQPGDSIPDIFFIEMGVLVAVSWMLCTMTVSYTDDSTELFIYLKQNKNAEMYNTCKREVKGFIKVEYHDFIMWYRLIDMGDGTTRIALVSFVESKIWIPRWLFRVTARRFFPGMVYTIERLLNKHISQR